MSILSDSVAIVTGASSGIGRATAIELAKHNVKVVCAARRSERLDDLVKQILAEGGHALAVKCDVSKRGDVERMVKAAHDTFGRIDSLINNAGIMPLSPLEQGRVEDWDAMIDINIKGVLYGVAAVLPHMLERGKGHIVNVSSVAGRRVFPMGTVYCGTKHAVHAISEGMRAELAEKNIRVTIIAPGLVTTELQAGIPSEELRERIHERMESIDPLTSEDIAHSILYAMQAPPHVSVNEVLIRPTKQEN